MDRRRQREAAETFVLALALGAAAAVGGCSEPSCEETLTCPPSVGGAPSAGGGATGGAGAKAMGGSGGTPSDAGSDGTATGGTAGTASGRGGSTSDASGGDAGEGTASGRGGSTSEASGGDAGSRAAGAGDASCEAGATKCSGESIQACGSDGEWQRAVGCAAHQSCTGPDGSAQCTCKIDPVCTSTLPACAGITALATCASDPNGCFYQSSSTPCANGACFDGACCTHACTLGATECANGGVRSCDAGSNGCGAWKIETCSSPLVCERYDGPTCEDGNWAEWPMPNTENGLPNPASYTSNDDGTVTDKVTKLIWEQTPSSATFEWEDAISYCTAQRTAGYADWRLPTMIELASLLDLGKNPAINPIYFPGTPAEGFWSSSGDGSVYTGWFVNFSGDDLDGYGAAVSADWTIRTYRARCVR